MHDFDSAVRAVVTGWLRALLTGDAETLRRLGAARDAAALAAASVALPPVARLVADLERAQLRTLPLAGNRHVVRCTAGGEAHLLLLHERDGALTVDERAFAASITPDNERQAVVRAFATAWLAQDAAAMQQHCDDADAVASLLDSPPAVLRRLLAEPRPARLVIVELAPGDVLHVGTGLEFVGMHHAACAVAVLSGLSEAGELPFLLRRRGERWTVLPTHLRRLQHATVATGGGA